MKSHRSYPPAKPLLIGGAAAASAASGVVVGLATAYARTFLAVEKERKYEGRLERVINDEHGQPASAVFTRDGDSKAPGQYGLYWDGDRGHAQVGNIIREEGAQVERRILNVTHGQLTPGPVRWSSYFYHGDPSQSLGLSYETVMLSTPAGDVEAWVIPAGGGERWSVLVHGRGARREETLRAVPVLHELGITCIIPAYRNDESSPASPDSRYGLGLREWEEAEAALAHAVSHGARRVDLLGWSMGGAISMQLLARTQHLGRIGVVVLDGPVLNWGDVMEHHARLHRLPVAISRLAGRLMNGAQSRHLVGLASPLDVGLTDWVSRSEELTKPMLVIHSVDDEFVPYGPSAALAEKRPDLVHWERWDGAHHVREWNTDSARWERLVSLYLADDGGWRNRDDPQLKRD